MAAALAISCSPRIIERVRTEYIYRDKHQRDSTYERNSVQEKEYTKNDTVYRDRIVDRVVFRNRYIQDSVKVEVHDTTFVPKVVEKELTWTQEGMIMTWPWIVIFLIGLLVWTFRKSIFKKHLPL